jgi:hypothetical protein
MCGCFSGRYDPTQPKLASKGSTFSHDFAESVFLSLESCHFLPYRTLFCVSSLSPVR